MSFKPVNSNNTSFFPFPNFKAGTPLEVVVANCWSRDCGVEQTMQEAARAGYIIDASIAEQLLHATELYYKNICLLNTDMYREIY